ncbi:ATP-binding protein [Streptomyces physcomitrii]|uniref:ATP-binding protein n=1 Tax=Streptomyces physcomitrii TaxID=2724184 RepID=UPI003429E325
MEQRTAERERTAALEPADLPEELPRKAAAARDQVRDLVSAGELPGADEAAAKAFLGDALLVTSELVTNALRHGDGMTDFTARLTADGLEITVSDRSPLLPRPQFTEGDPSIGGYGWFLIQHLSAGTTISSLPDGGKRIAVRVPFGAAEPDRAAADDQDGQGVSSKSRTSAEG